MDKTVLHIDLQKLNEDPEDRSIRITKGDVNAYQLAMRIYDGDVEFDYLGATTARMVFYNQAGMLTTNDNGQITALGVLYDIGATEISIPGRVMGSLQLLDDFGRRLTVSRFVFDVLPDPLDTGTPLPQVAEVEQLLVYIAAAEQALEQVYGGVHISASYATYEAFVAEHPTGTAGDIYMAGASLYVWVEQTNEWLNVGQIQGFGIPEDSDTVAFNFNPADSSLKADVIRQMSIAADQNGVKLTGDEATPDDGKFYGMIGGARGFYQIVPPHGWIKLPAMTRESDTSFSCASDLNGILKKGYRLRYKQGGDYLYQVILSVGAYTGGKSIITTAGGKLATVSQIFTNGVNITDGYYSPIDNPLGWPDWFDWTPTIVGFSTNPTDASYRFCVKGLLCNLALAQTTAGTSNATNFTISLPIAAASKANAQWTGWGLGMDNNGVVANPCRLNISAAGAVLAIYAGAAGAWTASGNKKLYSGSIPYEI